MTIYQQRMWKLQKEIFHCPGLFGSSSQSGSCRPFLPSEITTSRISPDSVFVGNSYGIHPTMPKILFIGNNPNSDPEDFGTLKSIIDTFLENYECSLDANTFYDIFFHGNSDFHGFKDFPYYNKNEYSIVSVLQRVFPQISEEILTQCFALANGVFCMGTVGDNNTPHCGMRDNCMLNIAWIRKVIEVIEPDIIFIFSLRQEESTWAYFSVENCLMEQKEVISHWNFAYRAVIQTHTEEPLRIKVFGIPHLTIPNFSSSLFRSFHLNEEFSVRILSLLDEIKRIIEE
jgi:hypothetical protein